MATSPVPTVCTTRGMSFTPTNGVAAQQRVETQIVEARERQAEAERDAARYQRTARGKRNTWGRS